MCAHSRVRRAGGGIGCDMEDRISDLGRSRLLYAPSGVGHKRDVVAAGDLQITPDQAMPSSELPEWTEWISGVWPD